MRGRFLTAFWPLFVRGWRRSFTATFFQGVTLGAFLDGRKVVDGNFSGGAFDWISPFSVFTGLALVAAYALLGATWLVMKTEGELQQRM